MKPAVPVENTSGLSEKFIGSLPFEFTNAQKKVSEHIMNDLSGGTPMHRLLQGDVGSGKTVVAFHALIRVIDAGYQTALMAPTEILAEQHYRTAKKLLLDLGVNVRLLTGNITGQGPQRNS